MLLAAISRDFPLIRGSGSLSVKERNRNQVDHREQDTGWHSWSHLRPSHRCDPAPLFLHAQLFARGFWGSNSGPRACKTSTWLTVPSPHHSLYIIFKNKNSQRKPQAGHAQAMRWHPSVRGRVLVFNFHSRQLHIAMAFLKGSLALAITK